MLSWRQRRDIGKLVWFLLFFPIFALIKIHVTDDVTAYILIAFTASFVYLIVPIILKALKIWH